MPNAGPGGRLTVFHDSPWEACIHPKLKCHNPDHVSFGTRSEEGEERRCSRVCVSHRVAISEDGLSHATVPLDAPRMSS